MEITNFGAIAQHAVFTIQIVKIKNPLNLTRTDVEIGLRVRVSTNVKDTYSDYYSTYNVFLDLVAYAAATTANYLRDNEVTVALPSTVKIQTATYNPVIHLF